MSRFRRLPVRVPLCLAFLALASCEENPSNPDPPDGGAVDIVATRIVEGLDSPIYLTAPTDDDRLFIVEQGGTIRILEDGQLLPTPFLDIRGAVGAGGERGLLSMAFHPDYEANGFFYVDYTDNDGTVRIVRYRVSPTDPNVADASTSQLLLSVEQPFGNHNGGLIKFGPDGMLFIGMGDGGSGGDPLEHGQNPNTLLGSLLRIDVDDGTPYGIPDNNPYASGTGGRPEIWAVGVRNPWRFSFDREAGLLYVADVGQSRREEINVVPANQPGLNFGWNTMEGTLCFDPMTGCNTSGLVLPVHEYANGANGSCSITGGYVYRGSGIPDLQGHYFYGDYCAGFVRSFVLEGGVATRHRAWELGDLGNITSFGEDAAGELYILVQEGSVYRISPAN